MISLSRLDDKAFPVCHRHYTVLTGWVVIPIVRVSWDRCMRSSDQWRSPLTARFPCDVLLLTEIWGLSIHWYILWLMDTTSDETLPIQTLWKYNKMLLFFTMKPPNLSWQPDFIFKLLDSSVQKSWQVSVLSSPALRKLLMSPSSNPRGHTASRAPFSPPM